MTDKVSMKLTDSEYIAEIAKITPDFFNNTEINQHKYRLKAIATRLEAMEWQPIETAPKDGSLILIYPSFWYGRNVSFAKWEKDEYARKPSPYWRGDSISKTISRANQPTHWMPLPKPPETA